MENRRATRESTHEFRQNAESVDELFPRVEKNLEQMEELADGYQQERVYEKLKIQYDELLEEFKSFRPTVQRLKQDESLMAYAE